MDFNVNLRSPNDSRVDNTKPDETKQKELVIVEWRDIVATAGWEQEPTCPTLFTVGWLIREDKDSISIASTKDPTDSMESQDQTPYYGFHVFPSGAVVRLLRIDEDLYPSA
jgi:hypothetical protein